ncbi:MAG: SMP-30/gluconolactonase/LRE family protein [Planctomycetota bacterium]
MRSGFCRPACRLSAIVLAAVCAGVAAAQGAADVPALIQRVTTRTPFPRGLAFVDGELHVLCRGRVRSAGGVSAAVDDQAGTIYRVDTDLSEPLDGPPSEAIRGNGVVVVVPTSPPFRLWDRSATPPESDELTDRPYCTLRYHEPTRSLYVCAFSGIDLTYTPADPVAFSKNRSDAVLRYDLRTGRWSDIERHDPADGDRYPGRDVSATAPPHGLLNGPDNCLTVGNGLFAVAKENSLLVRYDLTPLLDDPEAGPPRGEIVCGSRIHVEGLGVRTFTGQSALAERDGWLYVAYRTSSVILRLRLDDNGRPLTPLEAQLVARFDPFDAETRTSADITDMTFDDAGRLYVVCAKPSRVHRFTPDPTAIYDGRRGASRPWVDMSVATGNPAMKSENVLYHDGWLYVTSGDGYTYQHGAAGTVYRVQVVDGAPTP